MSAPRIKIASVFLLFFSSLIEATTGSAADASVARGTATFGDKPIFQSSSDIEYALSPDRQAFTITFGSFFEAIAASGTLPSEVARRARSGKSEGPVVARTFSIVLPVTSEKPIRTSFIASGFAMTGPDSSATLMLVVNGQQKVVRFGPQTERSFVEKLDFRAARASEVRMTAFLLAERSSGNADAMSFLRVAAIDTDTALAQRKMAGQPKK
jgi:hypothetical protein